MAKPLLAVETICDAALQLLDEQGAGALSARNLAASLRCSTRTLYQQVGKAHHTKSHLAVATDHLRYFWMRPLAYLDRVIQKAAAG